MCPKLPSDIQVIVRDWLNANHIVLFSETDNVLIDSGHVSQADATIALVRECLGPRKLHRLLNTHCHSDHCGGNAALRRAFDCTIAVPEGESAYVERWDTEALWLDYAGQISERFHFDTVIAIDERFQVGNHEWVALDAPGHDMNALMFWCERERILISGDALWEQGFGIVLPGPDIQHRIEAARDTLARIASLRAALVIPGHGKPFTEVDNAIAVSLSRLNAFAADENKLARHVLKVMFTFTLLERGSMAQSEVLELMRRAPLYAQYDRQYFSTGLEELSAWLLAELIRSGTIERRDHVLFPVNRVTREQ